jgi:hypothetical protein
VQKPGRWIQRFIVFSIWFAGALAAEAQWLPKTQRQPPRPPARSNQPTPPPPGTACVVGLAPPEPGAKQPAPIGPNSKCCSGWVDDHGLCTYVPDHSCTSDKECEGHRPCMSGRCCQVLRGPCKEGGASCCPGTTCKKSGAKSACVQTVFKENGAACAGKYECGSLMCVSGKCAPSCLNTGQVCGTAADREAGRACCTGQCAETRAGSNKYTCIPSGLGGCYGTGGTCDPDAHKGSPLNDCCGYCGVDHKCHKSQ